MKLPCKMLLLAIVTITVSMSACKPELVTQPAIIFQETNAWLTGHQAAITYGLNGQQTDMDQAFRQGYILIYGEGLPKKGIDHVGQRRFTAQRAAEVKAQQALAHVL